MSLAIAIFVAFIGFFQFRLARQQFELAHEKFKLDLFEKRFAVYRGVQTFLSKVVQNPQQIGFNGCIELLRDTADSVFLFDSEVEQYIGSLYKKSLDMVAIQTKYEHLPPGPQRSELCDKETKFITELTHELPKLKDVFGPYLKFKVWK